MHSALSVWIRIATKRKNNYNPTLSALLLCDLYQAHPFKIPRKSLFSQQQAIQRLPEPIPGYGGFGLPLCRSGDSSHKKSICSSFLSFPPRERRVVPTLPNHLGIIPAITTTITVIVILSFLLFRFVTNHPQQYNDYRTHNPNPHLISVVIGLVGSLNLHTNVISLLLRKSGELTTELLKMETSDHLIEFLHTSIHTERTYLGKNVHLASLILVSVAVLPKSNLSKSLVGEGVAHDEAGVTSSTTEVEESSFSKNNDTVSVRELEAINLRLDVDTLDARDLVESSHIDFVIEVTDVTDDGVVLHLAHLLGSDDVDVTGSSDEDIALDMREKTNPYLTNNGVETDDGEALHVGLEGTDGIGLRDVDDGSGSLHGLSAALADITVTADGDVLTSNHDIGSSHDTVGEGVSAAVDVIELGLGDGIVDVDGGEKEGLVLSHLVETMDTGGGLLRNAEAVLGDGAPVVLVDLELAADDGEEALELLVVAALDVGEASVLLVGFLGLDSLVDEEGHVATVVDDEVRAVALALGVGPGDGAHGALPVIHQALSLPGEDGSGVVAGDGGGGVVLGAEDVAGAPADLGTKSLEGLDEDAGLDGHMEGTADSGSLEGVGELLPAGHEAGHLVFGKSQFLASEVGEVDISDLERLAEGGGGRTL